MSNSIEFDESLKAVLEELDKLPAKFEANLVRGAMRAAAGPVLADVRATVPTKTGELARSLRITSAIKKKAGEIVVQVKAGSKKAWYAHIVESGAAAHFIHPKNGKAIYFGGRFFKYLHHPGIKGRGFMRRAFDQSGQASVDAYGDYVRRNMDKVFAKAGVDRGGN